MSEILRNFAAPNGAGSLYVRQGDEKGRLMATPSLHSRERKRHPMTSKLSISGITARQPHVPCSCPMLST